MPVTLTLMKYLDKLRGLIAKGYRVYSSDGAIELVNPKGELVFPLEAVFTEVTGRNWDDYNFSDAVRLMRMSPELGDRLTEAEGDLDTQWPKYRAAVQDALGITTVAA